MGGVSFVLPVLFSQIVKADEPAPACTSGVLNGDGVSSTVQIILYCTNIIKFASSGTSTADSADLVQIKLHPDNIERNPSEATIDGDQLLLTFYASDETFVRNININSSVILNSSDVANDSISILSEDIIDRNKPVITDDYYSVAQGGVLNVPADLGILCNDYDAESSVQNAALVIEPLYGTVSLNSDGSFIYTPPDHYEGDDSFTYSATDDAGNSNTATVAISDAAPVVTGHFYRQGGAGIEGYTKVGDTIRVDFESSGTVVFDDAVIAGQTADYQSIDNTHFYIYHVIQDDDTEGQIGYSVTFHDLSDNQTTLTTEEYIIFDKTKPIVNLNGDDSVDLEIHDSYSETATATDNIDDPINIITSGTVNPDVAGSYVITYSSIDSAGNQAIEVTRTVNVIDSTKNDFNNISNNLSNLGLANNLDQITADNIGNFSGLYIEKSINGIKMGRITFNDPINLSDIDTINFLTELSSRIDADTPGIIGIDFTNISELVSLYGLRATIKFYGLDSLGFNNATTSDNIFSNLTVFDDSRNLINKLELTYDHGVYVGCDNNQTECYTFTIDVRHFTKYVINKIIQVITSNIVNNIVLPKSLPLTIVNSSVYVDNSSEISVTDDYIQQPEKVINSDTPLVIIKNEAASKYSKIITNRDWIRNSVALVAIVVVLIGSILWIIRHKNRDI